jgi:hypothetical protein
VAIVVTGFMALAKAAAQSSGIAGLTIAEYPGMIMTDSDESFRAKVESQIVPAVVAGLTARGPAKPQADKLLEPEPGAIAFAGGFDELQDYYYDRGWTDGLPIVPPTPGRVQSFLKLTKRSPTEVIGVLAPEMREATVLSVAINGVMAGCRPELFPILLAIVEAIADPEFRIEDAGSTPGWESLVVVSGPLVETLDFNSGSGVLRVGRRANTSVGRFVRLYARNVAGLRIPPFATDKASIGTTFNVAAAEDDGVISELGWSPYRTDFGFRLEQSAVIVQSVVAVSGPIYSFGDTARQHLDFIALRFAETIRFWCFSGLVYRHWHPLLVLSPAVARVVAADGFAKTDVRQYLREHMLMTAADLERSALQAGVNPKDFNLKAMVDAGDIPSEYATSDDPQRLVPMCLKADWINIVVAGDPARNQSRVYVNNHEQGPPIGRLIADSAGQVSGEAQRE